ncbi:MAG: glycogenin glucosyltransferase [Alectoria fallacina]|uniref:glycogenin glucosyltransferase n=1 Tax=Alectoria fallacina TaxID=1903189 RepID=A0A8H3INZ7_9LECA|nr:MAG: glycogenin glucosyltransferase [Alectoria fallacina]
MAATRQETFCTLLTSDAYLPGAMVLAHSLRDNGTKKQLAILVTLDSLSASTLEELKTTYDHIIPVDRITNKSPQNLYLMNRPDLVSTFTKIALWRQTQFDHIVYIDADVVTLRAPDELFNNPPSFAAVPDIGWPDCFNSGVLSLKPNMGDYYALLALAQRGISFDGADQGLLNMHFRDWQRLSFTYNCTPSGSYQYVPAYRHFQSQTNMVHFIGNEKPWLIGREQKGASGVYEELLGRWWAVYDKHYRTTTTAYNSRRASKQSRSVQQYVEGETSSTGYGFDSIWPQTDEFEEPEAPAHTTEPSLTDKTVLAEDIQQGEVKPTPTAQQRRFSIDWDPMHNPPPAHSRPEAANFPTETYKMSEDRKLFHAPKYAEPPKDMYYQVPSTPPANERPKPIFPWETTAPKPTRVFADDAPPPAAPSEATPSVTTDDDDDDSTQTETMSPFTPTIYSSNTEPFATYSRTNAWDDVPEIERYISQLPQNRRAKVQVLLNNASPISSSHQRNLSGDEPMFSPSIEDSSQQHRPSMRLTDFPTEIERPSLPVTPAPVRRPSFWGSERDAAGDLPGAEGVPDQSTWDPIARLADLQRRQSEILAEGPASPGRFIPDRELPGSSSVPLTEVEEEDKADGVPTAGSTQGAMPTAFRTVDFNRGSVSRNREISEESVAAAPTES